MAKLRRDKIKYIRDKCKSAYNKDSSCYICSSTESLEFHHYNSMTAMLERWLRRKKYSMGTVEEVELYRDEFIAEHYDQIYNKTVTLCKACHTKLHGIYGAKPNLGTAAKQERWVERMKNVVV